MGLSQWVILVFSSLSCGVLWLLNCPSTLFLISLASSCCAINEDHEIVAVARNPEFGVVSGIIHGYVLSLPLQFAELLQEFCAFFPFWGFSEFLADIYDTLLYLCVLGIPSCFPFLVGLSPVCP